MSYRIFLPLFVLIAASLLCSCNPKPNKATLPDGNFPQAVNQIFQTKCATAGCHDNANDAQNAGNLLLDSWDHLFNLGSYNGSVAIPYSPLYSSLLYFVNLDSSLGITAPNGSIMPPAPAPPLTKAEYMTLYNWITAGAPDKNGNIPFATNAATRQKIYIAQQGCDIVAVIDAATSMTMRIIPVGADPATIEAPHCIRVSSDGRYAYLAYYNGRTTQKIDCEKDSVVATTSLASINGQFYDGGWNILFLSPQDTAMAITNYNDGVFMLLDRNFQVETDKVVSGISGFDYPHGIAANPTFDTFFVTAQDGNTIYKIAPGSFAPPAFVSLNGRPAVTSRSDSATQPDPHEIIMSPDYSRYFVTCQNTNEVRVMDAHSDTLIKAIPVGKYPQEFALSQKQGLLYVTCMLDPDNPTPGLLGSVYVIDYNTLTVKNIIYGDFYQPHGIAVDEENDRLYVVSLNYETNGPPPHHVTVCGGRDGWYSVYNLNSLTPLNKVRYELAVYPYSATARFTH